MFRAWWYAGISEIKTAVRDAAVVCHKEINRMAQHKYIRKSKKSQSYKIPSEMTPERAEKNLQTFPAWCDWCSSETPHDCIKSSFTQTERGGRWGRLARYVYRCDACGHIKTSRAWTAHKEQANMFDVLFPGEREK